MAVKQSHQFSILGPPELEVTLEWPHIGNAQRCVVEHEGRGVDFASLPMYLREAAQSIEDRYKPVENNDLDSVKAADDVSIKSVNRWEIIESDVSRIMITGHDTPYKADYVRDWTNWPVEELDSMEKGFTIRKDRISKHQKHNFRINSRFIDEYKSVERLFGKWKNKTVIFVGSGPGLRKNHQHIPENDDQYVVIAINRAAKILEPEQIDYCVAVDKDSDPDWYSPEVYEHTPLLMSLMVEPNVQELFDDIYTYRAPKVELSPDGGGLDKVSHLPYLANCLHATYTMYHLAYLAGAQRFIFVGQDFSVTSDRYYADKKMTMKRLEARNWWHELGVDGHLALTNRKLRRSANILLGQSAFLAADGCEVINATERGLLDMEDTPCKESDNVARNTHNMPLKEAVK